MRTPLPRSCLACTVTLTLTSLFSLLPGQLPSKAQPVPTGWVCISPGFGFDGSVLIKTADHRFCAGATPATSTENELFWVPTRLNKRCISTGDRSATLTNRKIRIVNLHNLNSGRRLTFTGTGQGDVLVGSPGTSDWLIGGGGNDTYVVGGKEASLILGPGDRLIPVSAVTEVDKITLGASAEYIYINPGPGGQNNPGTLLTPIPGTPATSFTPGGSSAIPPSMVPDPADCRASIPGALHFASTSPFSLLASLPKEDAPGGAQSLPLLFAQATPPSTPGSKAYPGCQLSTCAGGGEEPPNSRLFRDAFPGAPTLEGFSLDPARADRILIPEKDLTFRGQPINEFLRQNQSLKVLVVDRVDFAPPQVVSPERLRTLRKQSKGLARVHSEEAPLIYFRQNGLLVFSSNGEPLGSRNNPGLIIAQLLNERGRPLALPTAARQRFYEATFLEFLPNSANLRTVPERLPAKEAPR